MLNQSRKLLTVAADTVPCVLTGTALMVLYQQDQLHSQPQGDGGGSSDSCRTGNAGSEQLGKQSGTPRSVSPSRQTRDKAGYLLFAGEVGSFGGSLCA
ncbi:hypothetical protein NDU88_001835 [Pleurodeles waltl]|uniref:Uncharacterized protein n=1 Tax=Pleurodeles waltl TaxID=8319 RepID=A0AAV7RCR1_PLEWA|nr:hypothetical protein NDU88_001835 [Pleurodeles waltl]